MYVCYVCMYVCYVCMYVCMYVCYVCMCVYYVCIHDSQLPLQSVPGYSFNLAQSHQRIHQVGGREEKEEGLPALYLGKLNLWTLQQEIGRLKNDF